MNSSYWKQKATSWVSVAVLAGGLVSACLLFVLSRVEARLENLATPSEEEIFSRLENSGR